MGKQEQVRPEDLGDDLLVGVDAVAAFLKQPRRRVQHWVDSGLIPARKTGAFWTGLKSELRRHFAASQTPPEKDFEVRAEARNAGR